MNMESYEAAYKIGLDALERCEKEIGGASEDRRDALAALLAVVSHCAYAMAPSDKIAEELFDWARETAQGNWAKEKQRKEEEGV